MKKLNWLLSMVAVFSLCACGDEKQTEHQNDATPQKNGGHRKSPGDFKVTPGMEKLNKPFVEP